ncbi:hypothetical protein FA15DRAFT_758212 [Coprinopsis marcescibilis]|uniref:Uncharacterized protein n=1 Tax=Coprinopsis marcescibilis TaxID=230819 RepID=A0A5C3KP50_COPMA|nr:hypothetical protein FA15DRAFT_758212 [Coprinopsis marcescibilis]
MCESLPSPILDVTKALQTLSPSAPVETIRLEIEQDYIGVDVDNADLGTAELEMYTSECWEPFDSYLSGQRFHKLARLEIRIKISNLPTFSCCDELEQRIKGFLPGLTQSGLLYLKIIPPCESFLRNLPSLGDPFLRSIGHRHQLDPPLA